jgi:tetratricopeptide (TPR) repeat protein
LVVRDSLAGHPVRLRCVFEALTLNPPPGPARHRPSTGQDSCRRPAKVIVANHKRLGRATDIAPEHGLVFEARALLYWAENQSEKAISALRRGVELTKGSSRPSALLAARLAQTGQHDEARVIIDNMQTVARSRFMPPTHLAIALSMLGDIPAALDSLELALAVRDPRIIYLKDDWPWAPLRKEPRYRALLTRLGLDRYGPGLAPI